MIGFITLSILSAALLSPGYAQDYGEERVSRASYRGFDDDVELAKPAPTVVPILKQIDKHNDDGSYTYGFEAADGSFKIETKEANGEVRGKYGYTDANGKLHVVEYGANKFGFQPSGEGIEVPPVNFNAPEEPEEEFPQRVFQTKRPQQVNRPRPAIQQQYQPRPAVQQAPRWEQQVQEPIPAQSPEPVQLRPKHIIYNNEPAPVPKRPSFFAGAQPAAAPVPKRPAFFSGAQATPEAYQAPAVRRPAPAAPQAPRTHTAAYTTAAPQPQQNFFIPSSQFRQQVQYAQPSNAAKAVQYQEPEDDGQYYRPQPAKAQLTQFAEPEYKPQVFSPRPASKVAKGGFFDQLEEQYSLPKGNGQPTHDIAFGFF